MKALISLCTVGCLVAGTASGQDVPAPQSLRQAMEDIQYVELLNGLQLTPEQLDALLGMQSALQAEAALDGELATAVTRVLAAVLSGMSQQEAQQAAGPQPILQQAQQRLQQAFEQSAGELQVLLTPEQQDRLVWFGSPARALEGVVEAVTVSRAIDDAQWQRIRPDISRHVAQLAAQVDPGRGASAEAIAALLDEARGLEAAAFEAKRPTLAREWLPAIMPGLSQRLQDPQFRQQQARQLCQHLLAYERGSLLVEARRDVAGAQ
jgi:hypothetical protein